MANRTLLIIFCALLTFMGRAQESTNLIHFTQGEYAINEASTNLLIRVVREGDSAIDMSVEYTTELLTANEDDLTLHSGTLQFAAGETNKFITIEIHDDDAAEPEESFRIILSNPSNEFTLGEITEAQVTIEDNDHAGGVDGGFYFEPYKFAPPNSTLAINRVLPLEEGDILFGGESTGFHVEYGIVVSSGQPRFAYPGGSFFDAVADPDGSMMLAGKPGISVLVRLSGIGSPDLLRDSGATGIGKVVTLAPDRSILLGGSLKLSGESDTFGLLRILRTMQVDHAFPRDIFANKTVSALLVQGNHLYVATSETNENQTVEFRLRRHFVDGTPDESFAAIQFDEVVSVLHPRAEGGLLVGGRFTQIGGEAHPYLAQLGADGVVDSTFNPAINGPVHSVAFQPDGKLLAGGEFTEVGGAARSRLARLNADGSLDSGFEIGSGPNGPVRTVAVLPDGGILAGGHFNGFSGKTNSGLVRLKGDVAEGASFVYWERSSSSVHEQAGSGSLRILRAGRTNESLTLVISEANGTAMSSLDYGPVPEAITFAPGEMVADLSFPLAQDSLQEGTETFQIILSTEDQNVVLSRASANVRIKDADSLGTRDLHFESEALPRITALAVQDDGKILVGYNRLVRLHPDGTVDESFRADIFTNITNFGFIYGVSREADGKYYAWGTFDISLTSPRVDYLLRLHDDGSLDETFTSPFFGGSPTFVGDIAVHPSGTIFVCEQSSPGGQVSPLANSGARLNPAGPAFGSSSSTPEDLTITSDGTIFLARSSSTAAPVVSFNDQGVFTPGFSAPLAGAGFAVEQYENRILLGGLFRHSETGEAMNLALLNLDGSIDTNFVARPNGRILNVVPLADGRILISGDFTAVNGIERNRIARLNSDGTVDETFNPGLGFDSFRMNIAEMPDGKIIAASADFGHYDGEPVPGLIRLLDLPRAGKLRFTKNFVTVSEEAGNVALSIERVGGSTGPLATRLTSHSQAAVAGTDFEGVELLVEYGDGEIAQHQVSIPITPNPELTGDKTFALRLADASTGEFFDEATILIQDEQNGSPDASYTPSLLTTPTPPYSIELAADGGVVLAGAFTQVNGQPRSYLARLAPDGSLDDSFVLTTPPSGGIISDFAFQPDGKIIVGGSFRSWGGNSAVRRIARLNPDFSLDMDFSTRSNSLNYHQVSVPRVDLLAGQEILVLGASNPPLLFRLDHTGAEIAAPLLFQDRIFEVEALPDGSALIGASGIPGLTKIKADHTLDETFPISIDNGSLGGEASVRAVQAVPDGKILIGGRFLRINGTNRYRVAQLLPNGTLEPVFDPGVVGAPGPSGNTNAVEAIELLPGGDILIAGNFETVQGVPRRHLARLAPDGTLRQDWDAQVQGTHISEMKLLDNGELAIYGGFTNVGGVEVHGLARIRLAVNASPVVEIVSPTAGAALPPNAPVAVRLNAYDPDGLLTSLKLFLNGELHTEFEEPPYVVQLTPEFGSHTLQAQATDASGFTTSSEITFTVANLPEAPTLTFAAGTEGNLQISLHAPLGATCALEISSDLEMWSELEQTVVSESPVQFLIDPTGQTHLFYRVRMGP